MLDFSKSLYTAMYILMVYPQQLSVCDDYMKEKGGLIEIW